ncbi:MAG TPA: TlpA disulfide reductase family protein [Aggregatilineales bacterium]|nr:TlpA disulfide reductase family protein [Aggregatilineales bacterium]
MRKPNQLRHANSLLILLIFPLIGFVGMGIMLLTGGSGDDASKALNTFPTPPPLVTTPVPTLRPTVTPKPVIDAPAPDMTLMTFDGESFTLADLRGKPVIVNFWATWCPPCVREMPLLQSYAEAHPDVILLAVTDPEDGQTLDDIQAFINEYGLHDLSYGLDKNGMLRINFNGMNLPMTFVLDSEGIVRFRQIGEVTEDDLNYYLREVS